MNRLSALDASFLEVEDAVSHMHIASDRALRGPRLSHERAARDGRQQAAAGAALPAGRAAGARSASARPVWVDDAHFNLDYHLRRTALPEPGGEERAVHALVGALMSQQLDRSRPLWEMWAVEGLDRAGGWALVSKTHHCMVDGVSAADLLTVMLDTEPIPAPASRSSTTWSRAPAPSEPELLVRALADDLLSPLPDGASAALAHSSACSARATRRAACCA